jgi:hypothetical protein
VPPECHHRGVTPFAYRCEGPLDNKRSSPCSQTGGPGRGVARHRAKKALAGGSSGCDGVKRSELQAARGLLADDTLEEASRSRNQNASLLCGLFQHTCRTHGNVTPDRARCSSCRCLQSGTHPQPCSRGHPVIRSCIPGALIISVLPRTFLTTHTSVAINNACILCVSARTHSQARTDARTHPRMVCTHVRTRSTHAV